MPPFPKISESMIDDLLYFSRTADSEALQVTLGEASKEFAAPPHDILATAIDADSGNSSLHMAAANGHTEIIKLILSLTPVPSTSTPALSASSAAPPALINLVNKSGNTPLHWAALNGHLEAVKALVDAGADVDVKNAAGHDAAFEAEQAQKEEVASWLVGAGNERASMDVKEEDVAENSEMNADGTNGTVGDPREQMASEADSSH
ncbi:MAG: hypothetical protein LQ340_004905 [Diploschistes diacapsis]|nr:MAG: hypothetical protein LQ340_004905 [Diploschistes diacapsis]